MNVTIMLFGIILYNVNPIPFFVTTLIGHGFIAGFAIRDPHLSNLMAAWIETRRKTANLVGAKGNKYVG